MKYGRADLLPSAVLSAALDWGDYVGSGTQLFERLRDKWPGDYSDTEAMEAVREFTSIGDATVSESGEVDDFVRVHANHLVSVLRGAPWKATHPVLHYFAHFGDQWLDREWKLSAPHAQAAEAPVGDARQDSVQAPSREAPDDVSTQDEPQTEGESGQIEVLEAKLASASDRSVGFDHNAPQLEEALEKLEQSIPAIEASNDPSMVEIAVHVRTGVEFIRRCQDRAISTSIGLIRNLVIDPFKRALRSSLDDGWKLVIQTGLAILLAALLGLLGIS